MPTFHHSLTVGPDNPDYDMSADEWNETHDTTSGSATVLAGTTYIDVTHGLATTPDISKIILAPQDDLGGRGFWISDVGATTFRINISSMDIDEDHVIGYVIL